MSLMSTNLVLVKSAPQRTAYATFSLVSHSILLERAARHSPYSGGFQTILLLCIFLRQPGEAVFTMVLKGSNISQFSDASVSAVKARLYVT